MAPRSALLLVAVASCIAIASARIMSGPLDSRKEMAVPCYMKYYNSYCYLEKNKDTCTFYSAPSYATYKECATSTNMGKTLKCNEVPEAERKEARYATCVDKEPAAAPAPKPADKPAAKPAAKAQWVTKTDMDVEKRDIPCNGKAFCQLCKSLDEIKAACVAQKGCIAFTYDGKCGYLKTSAGTPMDIMTRRGWTIYTIVQNTGK